MGIKNIRGLIFNKVRINIVEHRFRVIVMPRKDLLDPQGRAVKGVISEMGIKVKDVKVGKVIEIVIEEKDEGRAWETVEELSRKVFSNPIIEDYKIEKI
jgi:phosphoribosylformylglycinamidine synthase subunit PurS